MSVLAIYIVKIWGLKHQLSVCSCSGWYNWYRLKYYGTYILLKKSHPKLIMRQGALSGLKCRKVTLSSISTKAGIQEEFCSSQKS